MTILRFELKMLRKSIIIWSIAHAAFLLMYIAFYPTFGSNAEMMDLMLENYPEEFLKAFGMNTGLPLSSVMGYFGFSFTFIQLMLAIQASNYGFSVLSVEERDLTADFLMTKPVSRTKVIICKFTAVLIALTMSNAVIWGASYLALALFNDGNAYDAGKVALVLSTNTIFQLYFVAIGMVVTVSVKKVRSVLSYSMALAFGTYMLNSVGAIVDSDFVNFLTPFSYFKPEPILASGSWDMALTMICILLIVVLGSAAYILYRKRNIHSL